MGNMCEKAKTELQDRPGSRKGELRGGKERRAWQIPAATLEWLI